MISGGIPGEGGAEDFIAKGLNGGTLTKGYSSDCPSSVYRKELLCSSSFFSCSLGLSKLSARDSFMVVFFLSKV
jgi:hypothetical protein